MTQIKKILDKQGNEVFIRTSTKAVVDGNGCTAESRLQAMQDEINQAQLEVGAVPSDLSPTEGSTNWVTSDGIFKALSDTTTEVINVSALTQYNYTLGSSKKWTSSDSTKHVILSVESDEQYIISNSSNVAGGTFYGFLANHTYVAGGTVPYVDGYDRIWLNKDTERTITIPTGTVYLCLPTIDVDLNDITWSVTKKETKTLKDTVEGIEEKVSDFGKYKSVEQTVDFGTLVNNTYCIVNSGKWSSTTVHSVYFKPVVPGEKYKIIGNATAYSFYAFLKTTTSSASKNPDYADGENGRHSIGIGSQTSIFTIPATTNYLYICNTNNGENEKPQSLIQYNPINEVVESLDEDVNNIKDKLGMNDGSLEGFSYYGEKISFYNTMSFTKYASNSVSGQSSAIYGDYLFIVKDKLTNVICYNMSTKTVLYNLATGLSKDSTWHCNQCQFGTLKYSQDDMFPVLYITVTNNAQGRCSWVAYRIIPTLTDNEISSFTIEEVQTIYLPAMTDENCLGNFNIAVDHERGFLWGYGRNNNSNADSYQKATFARFPMPPLSEQTVTYEDSDIITSFMDTWWMAYAQGGFIKNGKLVIMQGYASVNLINLRVIDLYVAKRQVSYVSLLENGFTEEPEGVFFYNGSIYTSTNNSNIWKIVL